jgi:hypothetical protein
MRQHCLLHREMVVQSALGHVRCSGYLLHGDRFVTVGFKQRGGGAGKVLQGLQARHGEWLQACTRTLVTCQGIAGYSQQNFLVLRLAGHKSFTANRGHRIDTCRPYRGCKRSYNGNKQECNNSRSKGHAILRSDPKEKTCDQPRCHQDAVRPAMHPKNAITLFSTETSSAMSLRRALEVPARSYE